MAVLRFGALPEEALAAASRFHAEGLPEVIAAMANKPRHLTLVFPPADHTHRAWRLAVVQGLAREYAPIRVSALASDDEAAIAAALSYLEQADGVTGQLLLLDGFGAGEVIHSQL